MTDTVPASLSSITVAPTEFKFILRLKPSRFVLRISGSPLGDLQQRLDRVSKYVVRRLQRKYPALAVSRPTWSLDTEPGVWGMPKRAFCYFDYLDLTPYTDEHKLVILPPQTYEVAVPQNRAARRAQRD